MFAKRITFLDAANLDDNMDDGQERNRKEQCMISFQEHDILEVEISYEVTLECCR